MSLDAFLLFVAAGLLLNITPGPDMALVMARSASGGWRAGAVAAVGVAAGCVVHIAAAALGVSALLLTSAWAFTVLKILGAAYLVVMGILMVRGSFRTGSTGDAPRLAEAPLAAVFAQGFLTNALNPKVALFFLAFLPQFIPAGATDTALLFVVLGLVFNTTGTLVNLAVAWMTARVAGAPAFTRGRVWLERVTGALFVGLGIQLVASRA